MALMKQDPAVVRFFPDLIGDGNHIVPLGAMALAEELAKEHGPILGIAVPALIKLLGHENPTIRDDVANALGIIRDRAAVQSLMNRRSDEHPPVREIVRDVLQEINRERPWIMQGSLPMFPSDTQMSITQGGGPCSPMTAWFPAMIH